MVEVVHSVLRRVEWCDLTLVVDVEGKVWEQARLQLLVVREDRRANRFVL